MRAKLIGLIVFTAALLCAQYVVSVPQSVADITGGGATVQLTAPSTTAQWVQFGALPANAANVRWGGPTTDATHGMFLAPGGGQFLSKTNTDLSQIYLYIANSDKVAVTWGK